MLRLECDSHTLQGGWQQGTCLAPTQAIDDCGCLLPESLQLLVGRCIMPAHLPFRFPTLVGAEHYAQRRCLLLGRRVGGHCPHVLHDRAEYCMVSAMMHGCCLITGITLLATLAARCGLTDIAAPAAATTGLGHIAEAAEDSHKLPLQHLLGACRHASQ